MLQAMHRTSFMAALRKLNLLLSKGWQTRSTQNSVARFFVARPSFSCATKPYTPAVVCSKTALVSRPPLH